MHGRFEEQGATYSVTECYHTSQASLCVTSNRTTKARYHFVSYSLYWQDTHAHLYMHTLIHAHLYMHTLIHAHTPILLHTHTHTHTHIAQIHTVEVAYNESPGTFKSDSLYLEFVISVAPVIKFFFRLLRYNRRVLSLSLSLSLSHTHTHTHTHTYTHTQGPR